MNQLQEGEVLVTEITDPDWEPILKRASGLVTERGGRTSHAAIIARELGIPAIVGATGALTHLDSGSDVTVSCSEGEIGYVYDGSLRFAVDEISVANLPETQTDIMVNLGDPSMAYKNGTASERGHRPGPNGVHLRQPRRRSPAGADSARPVGRRCEVAGRPRPLQATTTHVNSWSIELPRGRDLGRSILAPARSSCDSATSRPTSTHTSWAAGLRASRAEPDDRLARGEPLLPPRLSRRIRVWKSRRSVEFARQLGLTNLKVMIPFCRTPEEGRQVLAVLADNGLPQGKDGLEVFVMAEIPANVLQADEFASIFDGFSIGSNDLTQLTLGVDRDSESVAHLFDERNPQ